MVDLIWAVLWKHAGKWSTKDVNKIRIMEKDLTHHIVLNSLMVMLLAVLAVFSYYVDPLLFVAAFITLNLGEAIASVRLKLMSVDIF